MKIKELCVVGNIWGLVFMQILLIKVTELPYITFLGNKVPTVHIPRYLIQSLMSLVFVKLIHVEKKMS